MNKILVSIIVPVYRVSPEYLRECFDSLSAQTLCECEFIVVSDGAPKALCSICEEYADKDSRFKYFKREHAGVSSTRNYGIEQAQGEYISFVDSDDWVNPDYLSFFKEFERKPDVVFFKFILHFNNKMITTFFPQETFASGEKKICESLIELFDYGNRDYLGYVCNKFFKKSIIDENNIRFPKNISFMEDYIFALQYYQHISNLYISNKELYHYRLSMNGLTFAKLNPSVYYDVSAKIADTAKAFPNDFRDALLNIRVLFLHFLSVVKQKGIIHYNDYAIFRKRYLKEHNSKYDCLTLRFIFSFTPITSYFLCYVYKFICFLPGLRFPGNPTKLSQKITR